MSDDSLNPIWSEAKSGFDLTAVTKVGTLPVRGETRLVPVSMTSRTVAPQANLNASGSDNAAQTPTAYEAISFAKSTFTDFMTVGIPSRPETLDVVDSYFTYRFLINPHTVTINHQTLDSLSMTRSGWQFGIWGEDTVELHMTGMTAGDYFQNGLTDQWEEYSLSYRNLFELVNVVTNNGYWFEGEEVNPGWNAPNYSRKRIKSHGDVQVSIGNFIWNGMFTNMTVTQSADNPFYNIFDIGFIAWKERFVQGSPWISSKRNNIYRGHSREILVASAQANASALAAANATTEISPSAAAALGER